ncbi:MAG: DUF5011 domain-containing protein [Candidatus Hydrogenedentes bacterium]|nr:DUF5011 domain-containing protein [Candidatus Hydrogenedentota bacterium]
MNSVSKCCYSFFVGLVFLLAVSTTSSWGQDLPISTGMTVYRQHESFYHPGQPFDITITILGADLDNARAIGLEEYLPEDWRFLSLQGDAYSTPAVAPEPNSMPPFGFAWIVPPRPICVFTYTVLVPESAWGNKELLGNLEYRLGDGPLWAAPPISFVEGPEPQAPELTLLGANPLEIQLHALWQEPGYTAIDHDKQDISAYVLVTGSVDTQTPGEYTLEYSVSSRTSEQNATATRHVIVLEEEEALPARDRPASITAPPLPMAIQQSAPSTPALQDQQDAASAPLTEEAQQHRALDLPDLSALRPKSFKDELEERSTDTEGEQQADTETEGDGNIGEEKKEAALLHAEESKRKQEEMIPGQGSRAKTMRGSQNRDLPTEEPQEGFRVYLVVALILVGIPLAAGTYLIRQRAYKPGNRRRGKKER